MAHGRKLTILQNSQHRPLRVAFTSRQPTSITSHHQSPRIRQWYKVLHLSISPTSRGLRRSRRNSITLVPRLNLFDCGHWSSRHGQAQVLSHLCRLRFPGDHKTQPLQNQRLQRCKSRQNQRCGLVNLYPPPSSFPATANFFVACEILRGIGSGSETGVFSISTGSRALDSILGRYLTWCQGWVTEEGGSGSSSIFISEVYGGASMWEDAVVSYNVCDYSFTARYGRRRGKRCPPEKERCWW